MTTENDARLIAYLNVAEYALAKVYEHVRADERFGVGGAEAAHKVYSAVFAARDELFPAVKR